MFRKILLTILVLSAFFIVAVFGYYSYTQKKFPVSLPNATPRNFSTALNLLPSPLPVGTASINNINLDSFTKSLSETDAGFISQSFATIIYMGTVVEVSQTPPRIVLKDESGKTLSLSFSVPEFKNMQVSTETKINETDSSFTNGDFNDILPGSKVYITRTTNFLGSDLSPDQINVDIRRE